MLPHKKDFNQQSKGKLSQDMQKIRDSIARLDLPKRPEKTTERQFEEKGPETMQRTAPVQSFEQISKKVLDIPEPPKPKEIVTPQIEKGPLFISKDKFFEAEGLVETMKELSASLSEHLNVMRETLNEDLGTVSQLEDLLSEVEGKINSLKEIVSPQLSL